MAVEDHNEDSSILVSHFHLGKQVSMIPAERQNGAPDDDLTNLDWLRDKSEEHAVESRTDDEELTSLTWLQDRNLLKNFRVGSYGLEGDNDAASDDSHPSSSEYLDDVMEHVIVDGSKQEDDPPGGRVPYDPAVHASAKPPFSFSCLIFMAIEDHPRRALPVKDIYGWILDRFPYFRTAPTGWKNSVRHNLSLNKCFRKVDREKGQNVGKGSLWCVDPEFRPNLLQAMQKGPSMTSVDFSHFVFKEDSKIKPCFVVSAASQMHSSDPEVDAAATMLTLKNGPSLQSQRNLKEESLSSLSLKRGSRINGHSPPPKKSRFIRTIVTSSPSEDHTYSASLDSTESSSSNEGRPQNPEEEGAHALMSLAEIASMRLFTKSVLASGE